MSSCIERTPSCVELDRDMSSCVEHGAQLDQNRTVSHTIRVHTHTHIHMTTNNTNWALSLRPGPAVAGPDTLGTTRPSAPLLKCPGWLHSNRKHRACIAHHFLLLLHNSQGRVIQSYARWGQTGKVTLHKARLMLPATNKYK